MRIILPLLAAAALAALLVRHFLKTRPADLVRQLKMAAGALLLLAAIGLLFVRQFALALPLAGAGLMILRRQASTRVSNPSGQTSGVRSAGLEMVLDHESGKMDGRILAGRQEGKLLSELSLAELIVVREDFLGDAESSRLLEAYLDRERPGWREDIEADQARRESAPARPGGMSTNEAYEILGLQPSASEADVREAHRRLMKQVHPDRGGSAALAAKINEAKERILGKHR
jgi:hypothetical protein